MHIILEQGALFIEITMDKMMDAFPKHCFRDLAITFPENVTSESGKNELKKHILKRISRVFIQNVNKEIKGDLLFYMNDHNAWRTTFTRPTMNLK